MINACVNRRTEVVTEPLQPIGHRGRATHILADTLEAATPRGGHRATGMTEVALAEAAKPGVWALSKTIFTIAVTTAKAAPMIAVLPAFVRPPADVDGHAPEMMLPRQANWRALERCIVFPVTTVPRALMEASNEAWLRREPRFRLILAAGFVGGLYKVSGQHRALLERGLLPTAMTTAINMPMILIGSAVLVCAA